MVRNNELVSYSCENIFNASRVGRLCGADFSVETVSNVAPDLADKIHPELEEKNEK